MTMMTKAPARFAAWMSEHEHLDRRSGHIFRYHSRSDAHSIKICQFVLGDLLESSSSLREAAELGRIHYGINVHYVGPSGKAKTLDLGLGTSSQSVQDKIDGHPIRKTRTLDELIMACEAKSTMTEHGKAQPRMFDELSSSHEIIHRERREAIAAGIAVINIATQFASPLRQTGGPITYSAHRQPHVASRMIAHLQRLPQRADVSETGFDAFCSMVIECDNVGLVKLWTQPPAPQPGQSDHYDTFLRRIVLSYEERFDH
jgi:hypothetical protein